MELFLKVDNINMGAKERKAFQEKRLVITNVTGEQLGEYEIV